MSKIFHYDRHVILSEMPNIVKWLHKKADEAGSGTASVSGLDCKVAADTIAGLLELLEQPQSWTFSVHVPVDTPINPGDSIWDLLRKVHLDVPPEDEDE